ncbi:transketolase family protein [Microbacterium halophytorum]|uniref:transketolase family protein n=1 Tax=Microbacterium halophytorum TaxID=2067568 RepID=UPI000CFC1C40|nr:transketolase C-terminal domain-containing protein [Microbacterium halophytorum]
MKAQRLVWGETLADLAANDQRVVVLDGDLATSTRADIVAEAVPGAFIEVGIAEQNMVGMAFGLSTLGYRPWLSTFGVFLTHRAVDQLRMLVSQTKAPVRVAAAYSGLLNGSSGKTHQDIEDLAIMRAMPNMTVIAPADEHEAEAVFRWAAEHDGPVYVRVARDAVSPVFDESYSFAPGVPHLVAEGTDVTLISTGVQTSRTLEAVSLLAQRGISAKLIHLPTLKPLDADRLVELIGDAQTVVTVEEHSRIGGLGGLVSEVLSERGGTRVIRIGLEDRWSESAPNDFLLDKYGLSPERVAAAVVDELARSV